MTVGAFLRMRLPLTASIGGPTQQVCNLALAARRATLLIDCGSPRRVPNDLDDQHLGLLALAAHSHSKEDIEGTVSCARATHEQHW
jgi:hypothetical protein